MGYGTLCRLGGGRMIAYIYNKHKDDRLEYRVTDDNGRSWSEPAKTSFAPLPVN